MEKIMGSISSFITILIVLSIFGCATENPKKRSDNTTQKPIIFDDEGIYSDTVRASINKITDKNGKNILKKNYISSRNIKAAMEGTNKIQIQCLYRGYFNFQWIEYNMTNSQEYVAYCLGDISDAAIGKKANALYAFISKKENFEENKKFNQEILDNPPTEKITSAIEPDKSRIVLFNKKSTFLGLNNSFPHKLTIDGKKISTIYPNTYLVLNMPNGNYKFKLEYTDVFTFKKEYDLKLEGGIIYMECQNGATSINAKILNKEPENFSKIYKPIHLEEYFK